jgi:hypothetical protein
MQLQSIGVLDGSDKEGGSPAASGIQISGVPATS